MELAQILASNGKQKEPLQPAQSTSHLRPLAMIALTLVLLHLATPSCAAAAEPYDKEQLQVCFAEMRLREWRFKRRLFFDTMT